MSKEKIEQIVKEFLPKLSGLNENEINQVTRLISYSVRNSPILVEFKQSEYDGLDKNVSNNF